MPKDEFNLDEFLAEREFEDDVEKAVVTKFFSKEKNQRAVLAQKAFDRKMDAAKAEAQSAVQALADKQAVLDDLVTRNIGYKGDAEKALEEFKTKTEKEIRVLKGKAVKAAELAGLELDEIEVDDPAPKARKAAELDLSELDKKYVTGEDLNRIATGLVNLTNELEEIKDVHEELFGKKMTRTQRETLLDEHNKAITVAQRDKKPIPMLMQTADRLHEYSEKRSETEKGKLAKLVADAEAKGYQKRITEEGDQGLPAPRRTGIGSVLFNEKTRKAGDAPVRDRGVKLALEAIRKQAAA